MSHRKVCGLLGGTLVSTLQGPRPVEALQVGDEILVEARGSVRITWIGTHGYIGRLATEHDAPLIHPVRVSTDALGEGNPSADLYLSSHHRLKLFGHLVEAAALINGGSVARHPMPDAIRYFHVELPVHGLLFANGAPVESLLPTPETMASFGNMLTYDWVAGQPPPRPCVPPAPPVQLEGIRRWVNQRSLRLGRGLPCSGDSWIEQVYENGDYSHLMLSVFDLVHDGALWPHVRFKLCWNGTRSFLEFRAGAKEPAPFVLWPGEQADEYGPYFVLRPEAETPWTFMGRDHALLRAIAAFLPDAIGTRAADRLTPTALACWRERAGALAAGMNARLDRAGEAGGRLNITMRMGTAAAGLVWNARRALWVAVPPA